MKKISCKNILVMAALLTASAGASETGNLFPFHLPNSRIQIFYPNTVSSLFLHDGHPSKASGVAPDMHIELPYPDTLTDTVDSWVQYISDLPNPSKGGAHRTGKK